jgi:transcriptional regulator with XRE-family HTH domain
MTVSGRAQPSEERRQLASQLRRLRGRAGISGRDLADRLEISQSTVSRIELGTAMPTLPQIERWAEITNASAEQRQSLVSLAERAFTEIHVLRTSLQAKPHLQDEIREREAGARMARTFQPLIVPGLMQTAEYARQVFSLSPLPDVKNIPAAVAGRMDRQLALFEPGRKFEFLINATALRWCPGPDSRMLMPQLDRISSLTTLESVSIGIIPEGWQAPVLAPHAFVIYEGHEPGTSFVSIEAIHASLTFHDLESINLYRQTWAALTDMAVFDDEARALIAEVAAQIRISAR